MKKNTLNLLLVIIALFISFSCSSDKDDKVDTDLGPSITTPALDNKSGGVYFVSTYAGEYIFRLNLKNGNDLMICEMFNNDKYSDLTPEKRDWMPGENLTHFEFAKDDIQLLISLDQDGEPKSKFLYNDEVWETVAYKSTAKEPVKVYSGTDIANYDFVNKIPQTTYQDSIGMIKINKRYFYGRKMSNTDRYNHTPELMEFNKHSENNFTFINPEYPNYPDYANNENTWYRKAEYNNDKVYSYWYDAQDYGDAEYILKLFRRFQ